MFGQMRNPIFCVSIQNAEMSVDLAVVYSFSYPNQIDFHLILFGNIIGNH